jgi:hypothetical protein
MLTRKKALVSIDRQTGPDRIHVERLSSIQQLFYLYIK